MTRALRSRVLHEMAERFEARAADLIQLLSIETGKVVPDATFEVGRLRPRHYCAALVCTEYGRVASGSTDTSRSSFVSQSVSPASAYPWNAPVALLIRSLAPALAAGCTTVVKMPGQTAQLNALISEVISEVTSLPRGCEHGDRQSRGPELPRQVSGWPDDQLHGQHAGRTRDLAGWCCAPQALRARAGQEPLVFDDADLDAALMALEKAGPSCRGGLPR